MTQSGNQAVTHVIARWTAPEAHRGRVRSILAELARRSEQEPWCASFIVLEQADEPGSFVLLEQYYGADGHDLHRAAPAFQDLVIGEAIRYLTDRNIHYYSVVK